MFYYSFTFKLPVNNIKVVFLLWNLVKQFKLALQKSHNLSHNSPVLLHNLPGKNRTISDFLSHLIRWSAQTSRQSEFWCGVKKGKNYIAFSRQINVARMGNYEANYVISLQKSCNLRSIMWITNTINFENFILS